MDLEEQLRNRGHGHIISNSGEDYLYLRWSAKEILLCSGAFYIQTLSTSQSGELDRWELTTIERALPDVETGGPFETDFLRLYPENGSRIGTTL